MKGQNPFTGPAPTEVHLPRAPLVKVLCQIRFPVIASLEKKDFIAPFQESIRHYYPELVQDQGIELSFTPPGGGFSHKVIWRMRDKSRNWQVSVGENFLSLETSLYTGRAEFLRALEDLVEKLQTTIGPDLVERVGLRYINRIVFKNSTHLSELLQPGVLGIVDENMEEYVVSTLSETRFTVADDLKVNGKWGLMPARQTYDPTVLPPIEKRSWILDIDGFSQDSIDFSPEAIIPVLDRIADIDYRLFRYTVTDALLEEYGGRP